MVFLATVEAIPIRKPNYSDCDTVVDPMYSRRRPTAVLFSGVLLPDVG